MRLIAHLIVAGVCGLIALVAVAAEAMSREHGDPDAAGSREYRENRFNGGNDE